MPFLPNWKADVYKRQDLLVNIDAPVGKFERKAVYFTVHGYCVESAVKAVSYTHLDVYKRQIFMLTMYRGIIMVSKGIIIVAMISMNTALRPLNLNLASPYPHNEDNTTVVAVTARATMREFRVLRRNMKDPSGPLKPFQ